MQEIASGLAFPEGPIALPDGSILVVEIARGTLTRVSLDGTLDVVAEVGGGPNGAAIGPDGACYVCNSGGFAFRNEGGRWFITGTCADDYAGGRIERVDLVTGRVDRLYDACDGELLRGPNDIVFDTYGGFYFTDPGKTTARTIDRGRLFYAHADGSLIRQLSNELLHPNGVGLSPSGDALYVAETFTGRLWAFDLVAPGVIRPRENLMEPIARLVFGLPGYQLLDSLAVDAQGHVCVATCINGGITRSTPDGSVIEHFTFPDPVTTNICFGGSDLATAYVTLSHTGRLFSWRPPAPGLRLNYQEIA